jgi:hypothetical protein
MIEAVHKQAQWSKEHGDYEDERKKYKLKDEPQCRGCRVLSNVVFDNPYSRPQVENDVMRPTAEHGRFIGEKILDTLQRATMQ